MGLTTARRGVSPFKLEFERNSKGPKTGSIQLRSTIVGGGVPESEVCTEKRWSRESSPRARLSDGLDPRSDALQTVVDGTGTEAV